MSKHSIATFINGLQKSNTEEDVKGVFTKHFDIQYDTAGFIDGGFKVEVQKVQHDAA